MSATQVLVTFTLASGYLQTFVLKVSGTTVSLGSILSTDVQVNLPNINLAQVTTVSSIKALVVLRNSSGMLQAITFNVNGMAVSIGVKATIADFVDVDSNAVTMLSASQAVVTYAGTSLYLQTSLLEVTPS